LPTYPKLAPKAPLLQHSRPNPVLQVGLSRAALHPLDGLTKLLFNTKQGGNNYITYHPNAQPDDTDASDLDPNLHLLRALFTMKSKAEAMPVRFEAIKGSPWPLTARLPFSLSLGCL
jgi:hypothetical protein